MSYSTVPNDCAPPDPDDTTEGHTHQVMTRRSRGHSVVELEGSLSAHSRHSLSAPVPDSKLESIHPDQSQDFEPTDQHGKARRTVRTLWLTVFLPVVAFAYLSFCYVAATRLVPVRIWMIDEPMEHLCTTHHTQSSSEDGIKAGVTTINIIIVAIALLPLKTLLDDIKAGLTYNTVASIPLNDINNVSIPSHTLFQGLRSITQNHASSTYTVSEAYIPDLSLLQLEYYSGAIISGIVAAILSSLAPAALSIGLVATDSEIAAIQVGAIKADSVIDVEDLSFHPLFQARTGEAASRGWVQNVLGAEIAFTPISPRYAVPVPLNLESTARARYLTDIVVLDPVCSWSVPDAPLVPFFETYSVYPSLWVNLTSPGVGIKISLYENDWVKKKHLDVAGSSSLYPRSALSNLSNSDPVTDGAMAWIIAQCMSCNFQDELNPQPALDLSEIPTRDFSFNVTNTSDNTTTSYTTRLSALVCKPYASIETREVLLDGNGKLQVMEYSGLVRQGNLHLGQTQFMLAYGLLKYTTDSGPETDFTGVGRAAQVQMFFDPNLSNSTETPTLKPQSTEKIAAQYGLAQQAALRSYLSGEIASAYVPGRVQVMKLVFTSSLPHIIVSTILFALVALFINLCYLRSEMEQFTLFSVATVLVRSNLGSVCEDAKYRDRTDMSGGLVDASIGLVGDRRLYLTHKGGPGPALHME